MTDPGVGLAMKPRLNKTQLNSRGWALGRSRRLRAYPPSWETSRALLPSSV